MNKVYIIDQDKKRIIDILPFHTFNSAGWIVSVGRRYGSILHKDIKWGWCDMRDPDAIKLSRKWLAAEGYT